IPIQKQRQQERAARECSTNCISQHDRNNDDCELEAGREYSGAYFSRGTWLERPEGRLGRNLEDSRQSPPIRGTATNAIRREWPQQANHSMGRKGKWDHRRECDKPVHGVADMAAGLVFE